jgi:hypothetical protein
MEIVASGSPGYNGYSYGNRADIFQVALDGPYAQRLRAASHLVRYTALEAQIRNTPIDSIELYVVRQETLPRS